MTPDEMKALAAKDPKAFADMIRPLMPEKAAEIDAALASNPDTLNVNVSVSMKLEKFDGEYEPGKVPVEVIEMEGD